MNGKLDPKALHGRWLRSHEEDTGSEVVFRPETHRFPPARGREGLELRPDGTAIRVAPGPTDVATQRFGRWRLDGGILRLDFGDKSTAMEVADASPDRLAMKR